MGVTEYILIAFPAVFVILNPLTAASTFLLLTAGQSEEAQMRVAKRACITAFGILIVFAIAGHFIFQMFRITVEAFRIAGGIILFDIGLNMLKFKQARIKQTKLEEQDMLQRPDQDIGVVPLGMPILSGPGAITTVIVLMAEIQWKSKWIALLESFCLVLSCAVSLFLIYYILINSRKLLDLLKITGIGVMTRIMGLILTVIATQFVINGIKDLVPQFAGMLK